MSSIERGFKEIAMWYNTEGQRHREDGPAIEMASGAKFWYINGKLHREDGPAVVFPCGTKFWHLNGKEYSEAKFNQIMQKSN